MKGEGSMKGSSVGNANAKTELVAFCQRKSGKSMSKGDIVYNVTQCGEEFQATVTIHCLGVEEVSGDVEEFSGEVASTEKEAEQAAATQALVFHQAEIDEFQRVKRKALEESHSSPKVGKFLDQGASLIADDSIKSKLHTAVKQLLGREADNTDIVYEILPADGGMQAKLTLPTLAEVLGRDLWLGETSPCKRDTRLNAAKKALEFILNHPAGQGVDLSKARVSQQKPSDGKGSSGLTRSRKGAGKGGDMYALAQFVGMMDAMTSRMDSWGGNPYVDSGWGKGGKAWPCAKGGPYGWANAGGGYDWAKGAKGGKGGKEWIC